MSQNELNRIEELIEGKCFYAVAELGAKGPEVWIPLICMSSVIVNVL